MLQARFGAALALSALLLAAVFMMQPYTPPRLTTSLLESFLGALEEYNTDLDSLPSSSTTRSAVEVAPLPPAEPIQPLVRPTTIACTWKAAPGTNMVMPFLGSSRHPTLASAKAACEPDVSCGGVVFADSLPSGLQYETRAPPTAAHPLAPFHSDSWVKIGCVGDQQKGSAPVQMTANTPSKTLPLEEQPAPANTWKQPQTYHRNGLDEESERCCRRVPRAARDQSLQIASPLQRAHVRRHQHRASGHLLIISNSNSLSSHGHTASSGSTPGTARLIAIAMS